MTPWPRSASRCRPWQPSSISGGTVSVRTWSPYAYRPDGSSGCASASSPWSTGPTRCLAPGAADGKPKYRRPWKRCARRLSGTPSRSGWLPLSLRSGRHGRPIGSKPFSAPPRPSKVATAFCRKCITIRGGCPNSAPRYGPFYITSIVAPRMVRHQRHAFFGGRSRISLKRCYPILRPCPNRGGENTK